MWKRNYRNMRRKYMFLKKNQSMLKKNNKFDFFKLGNLYSRKATVIIKLG